MSREATYEERATWGQCPVCQARPGQPCNPDVGISLGRNVYGQPPTEGAHLARLRNAPMFVELVAAREPAEPAHE